MTEDWTFLDEVAGDLEKEGVFDLGQGFATILADRVIRAVTSEIQENAASAQLQLERFYFNQLSRSPGTAALAAQGEGPADSPEAAAFMLGQIGFAHAAVARVASKLIDSGFERRLRARGFEQYVRLLLDEELSGRQIADRIGKDEAEVSRRLKVLRQMGAVECRREGNRVVNFLTPAARAVARARNMGALSAGATTGHLSPVVSDALDDQRHQLRPELRHSLVFVIPGDRRLAR